MISRKIMKIGHGSYMITLPKNWVRKNQLKEKDLLFLNELPNNDIILSKQVSTNEPEVFLLKISDEMDKEHFRRIITGKYIEGYERIEIQGDISHYSNIVHKLSNFLTGIELMEETTSKLVIESIIKPSDLPISKVTRRMAYLGRVMFSSFLDNDDDITVFEDSMDRLSYFALRCINQSIKNPSFARASKIEMPKLPFYLLVVRRLESIADQIEDLSLNVKKCKKNELSEIMVFTKRMSKVYEEASRAYLNSDKKKAQEIIDLEEEIEKRGDELTKHYGSYSTLEYVNCITNLTRIFDSITQMMEAVVTYC